jgi:hypothetical protein
MVNGQKTFITNGICDIYSAKQIIIQIKKEDPVIIEASVEVSSKGTLKTPVWNPGYLPVIFDSAKK